MSFLLSFSPTPHLPLPLSRLHRLLPIKATFRLPSQPPSTTTAGTASTSRSKNFVRVNPDNPRKSRLSSLASSLAHCDPSDIPSLITSASPPLSPSDLRHLLPLLGSPAPILPLFHHFLSLSPPRDLPLPDFNLALRQALSRRLSLPDFNLALRQALSLRHWPTAESLLLLLLSHGLQPNTATLSLAVACAVACRMPDRAVHWFNRLTALGSKPDAYTYSSMIRICQRDVAFSLYEQARPLRSSLHPLAFFALIRFHSRSGNVDGAFSIFHEMKALGVPPNVFVYNALLRSLAHANLPQRVKAFFSEMTSAGVSPDHRTYAVLLTAYSRGNCKDDAFWVYRLMKDEGIPLDAPLYNGVLKMCAKMDLVEEALAVFADMEASSVFNKSTFTFLFILLWNWERFADVILERILERMEAVGIQPNIFAMTTMIKVYSKAGRTDKVMEVFDRASKSGSHERLCCCLLNVMAETPKEDLEKVARCVEIADGRLGALVKEMIGCRGDDRAFFEEVERFLVGKSEHHSKFYCNYLIKLCGHLELPERASMLLDLANSRGWISSSSTLPHMVSAADEALSGHCADGVVGRGE